MVVRETADSFVLITQNDHALISGDIANSFDHSLFVRNGYRDDVLLAIYEHDRCWIPLDESPLWNKSKQRPYSFYDYPLIPKLKYYERGINEVEEMNKYAGLICSMHFAYFFNGVEEPESKYFFMQERKRQQRLMSEIECNRSLLDIHYQMLQFCDLLSLYLCLNEPGIDKENEIERYKEGFSNSEMFDIKNHQKLSAMWLSHNQVLVQGAPFISVFPVSIKYKSVSKKLIQKVGLEQAYTSASFQEHAVHIHS